MRLFTVSELYGPFPCEQVVEGEKCPNESFNILLSDEENRRLPEQTGSAAVNFIFKNKLGKAICDECLEKEKGHITLTGPLPEIEAAGPKKSVNQVWCECCKRGVTEDECLIESDPEKGEPWYQITHNKKGCGLVFSAHHRDFYPVGTERPLRNPFVPLRFPSF